MILINQCHHGKIHIRASLQVFDLSCNPNLFEMLLRDIFDVECSAHGPRLDKPRCPHVRDSRVHACILYCNYSCYILLREHLIRKKQCNSHVPKMNLSLVPGRTWMREAFAEIDLSMSYGGINVQDLTIELGCCKNHCYLYKHRPLHRGCLLTEVQNPYILHELYMNLAIDWTIS